LVGLRLALRLGCAIAPALGVYLLVPHVGYLHDGQRYSQLASHPFDNRVGTPWSLRIGVPLLVHLSPFSQPISFYGLAFVSLAATGLSVAAVVSQLGLSEAHACAAATLACSSELTAISFWSYYIDVEVLALYALTLWLASRRQAAWPLIPIVGLGVIVKEIVLLAAPLALLVWGRGRRYLVTSAAALAAGALVYIVEVKTLPTKGYLSGINATSSNGRVLRTQWSDTTTWLRAIGQIGVVRYSGNAILSVFGVAWILWLPGWRAAPPWLRRAQWWVLLSLPLFITAQWERTFAFYLPLTVPLAMLGARAWERRELVLLVAGSVWISAFVPTRTIADDRVTHALTKLAWMSPGFAAAAIAIWLSATHVHPRAQQRIRG